MKDLYETLGVPIRDILIYQEDSLQKQILFIEQSLPFYDDVLSVLENYQYQVDQKASFVYENPHMSRGNEWSGIGL